jgi:hypothetical protein
LLITVKSNKNWTKNEKILTKFGYLWIKTPFFVLQ